MRCVIMLLTLIVSLVMRGQSWQQVYDDVMNIDSDDETGELLQDSYELLEQLAGHPFDLNNCTREELELLPFLSAQQVMDIQEYLYHYGPMRSLGELRMIRSLDYPQLTLLPYFVYVSGEPDQLRENRFPRLDSLLDRSKHTLSVTLRVPFYERKGDQNAYLGYPYRHTLRYELRSGNYLRLGLVASQDAGEPFFTAGNSWGYDAYSYYLQLRQLGQIDNLIVGKYRLSAGMGLVLGQSFQLGKLAVLQNLGRSTQTIRPHSSRTEADYFQGAAVTFSLLRPSLTSHYSPLTLSIFASYRPIDATLTKVGEAQTLLTDGYHRTTLEMSKKGNTHITMEGTRLSYHKGGLRLGGTAVFSQLDRTLQPQRKTLYRRYYAHGRHFMNVSLDYAYTHYRFSLNGETATDAHGALATINTLSFQPLARISLMALQRFYSFRYTSLYGHAFGDGSRTQNESGFYIGATWNPLAHLRLQGYADYAYFPWARYGVSQSSESWDFLLQTTYQLRQWTLTARHRSHLRQKDNEKKTALVANDSHQERFSVSYNQNNWTLKTQLDLSHAVSLQTGHGWMFSQQASFVRDNLQLNALAALFDTDSYQCRIYIYERQLQHEFYFPTYYGHGCRFSMQARIDLSSHLRLAARLGYTNYFDRNTIGSDLQQINHSHQTDLDLQLRWKF